MQRGQHQSERSQMRPGVLRQRCQDGAPVNLREVQAELPGRGCPWGSRDAESGWRLSTQNGDCVLVLRSLYLHIDGLRTSSFKLGFGLCYIYRGSHASLIAISRKVECLLERSNR